jgi:hypothetical protein
VLYQTRARLVDVLATWGRHEMTGRASGRVAPDFDPVEFALLSRAPLVAQILNAHVLGVFIAQIEPGDVDKLQLWNGYTLAQWKAEHAEHPDSGPWYRSLAESTTPIEGPLVCTLQHETESPLWVWDGVHRVAAWSDHVERGQRYDIGAFVMITQGPFNEPVK